jgi:hypothetical protein
MAFGVEALLWLCVCVRARLASAWTAGRILFVLGVQEPLYLRSKSGEHSSSKNMGPLVEPSEQNCFLENASCNLMFSIVRRSSR